MKKSAAILRQHSLTPIAFTYKKKIPKGLHEKTIHLISGIKQEPQWMRDFRLNAYTNSTKFKL